MFVRCRLSYFGLAPSSALVVAALLIAATCGCRDEEPIRAYRVPHVAEKPVVAEAEPDASPAVSPADGVPGRLIGVLLPHAGDSWVFKVLGPDATVKPHVADVKAFVSSVKFVDGRPRFAMTKNWPERSGEPNRYATFVLDPSSTPPLELTVSQMSAQDVAENVNRWRGQVGLPKLAPADAEKSVEPLPTSAGPADWVELTGTYSAKSAMPPFARGAGGMPADHPPLGMALPGAEGAVSRTPPAGSPVLYEAPAAWTPVAPSEFNLAAFEVVEGSRKVRITVSEAQGDRLSNVNRWRELDLGLPPIDESALETAITKLQIGGRSADYVELVGTAAGDQQLAVYGVIVPGTGPSSWFIKLKGQASLALAERENFSKFLASLRFVR